MLQTLTFLFLTSTSLVQSICHKGCDLALASYYIVPAGNDINSISKFINTSPTNILKYNPNTTFRPFTRINLPFRCDCIAHEFLGHVFNYVLTSVDIYETIAQERYANLTTADWIQRFNYYDPNRVPDGSNVNVTVNCSCGDGSVSREYGLFLTYPLRPGETLDSVSWAANLSSELIRSYNPDANFSQGSGLVYIPWRDENGNYPPFKKSPGGAIGGITVVVVAVVLFLAVCLYKGFYRKKNVETSTSVLLQNDAQVQLTHVQGITPAKSVEFSYEELSTATFNFRLANKIGEGGFGAVFYAELRGQKAAIKKMDMQASRQFLAELKVLTQTHHLNLVRLIGYCVEDSLFLVYEYIENGNLSQHLHESVPEKDPLPWFIRVQIALDSARGIEYIHEHTIPVGHVHCDIKSANILIDKNFQGKVADFGLTRLTKLGSKSHVAGTFGYMPPEYVQYGDVSPKVDVFAFGVVLYELISAKPAIIKANEPGAEAKGLVALFDEVLSKADPKDDLVQLIDPRLGDKYPIDSVCKMAQLAKACTHEDPRLRPSMRDVVVELMTISSSSMEDWDVGPSMALCRPDC
ncbi:putative protein kinase RLK-Pelle-LysM family [Helianthus annuus]|nr:putative protein kinase RLK-Pelle-LysM family [Helianthus annuus]